MSCQLCRRQAVAVESGAAAAAAWAGQHELTAATRGWIWSTYGSELFPAAACRGRTQASSRPRRAGSVVPQTRGAISGWCPRGGARVGWQLGDTEAHVRSKWPDLLCTSMYKG